MIYKRLGCFSFCLVLAISLSSPVLAQKSGKTIANISFGDYQASDGQDTVSGSQLSLGILNYLSDEWAFFIRISNGSATGEHGNPDGSTTSLSSSMTSLGGGLQWSYDLETKPELTPFIGAGLSLKDYVYDFDYSDSDTGKTSGLGYGPLLLFGMKINVAKHFIVIPGYHFDQTYIESETGGKRTITSSGLSLALVLRF
ncbi:MAG: outer membrane beta-barrel protein [Proteobacteria bacterium]|nr:outer membrane beta-barrel protein [Pseudomonadota bacterium]